MAPQPYANISNYHAKILQGDTNEWHVQNELGKRGIDTVPIRKTYDLLIWEYDYKIEVKSSQLHSYRKGTTSFYKFYFQPYQIKKGAFDYAICLGLGDNNEVVDTYMIPHKVIEAISDKGSSIQIHPNPNLMWFTSKATNAIRFEQTKNRWDLFKIKNKSYFKRVQNKLANDVIYFEDNIKNELKKVFIDVFKDSNIKEHNKASYIVNRYGISRSKVYRLIQEWQLNKGGDKQ
jgi:hypothetical protein